MNVMHLCFPFCVGTGIQTHTFTQVGSCIFRIVHYACTNIRCVRFTAFPSSRVFTVWIVKWIWMNQNVKVAVFQW